MVVKVKVKSKTPTKSTKKSTKTISHTTPAKPVVRKSTIYTTDAAKNAAISTARKAAALVGKSGSVNANTLGWQTAAQASKPAPTTTTSSSPAPAPSSILDTARSNLDSARAKVVDILNPIPEIKSIINTVGDTPVVTEVKGIGQLVKETIGIDRRGARGTQTVTKTIVTSGSDTTGSPETPTKTNVIFTPNNRGRLVAYLLLITVAVGIGYVTIRRKFKRY